MEELFELKSYVEQGKYAEALNLIGEMEEMSRDDKSNEINAENRSTRSWDVSVRNAVRAILRSNKRRRAGGYYLSEGEFMDMIEDAYEAALDRASLEVFEGMYDTPEIGKRVDKNDIRKKALEMVLTAQNQH